jgi:predicted phage terminase large subunit-like protein
MKKIKPVELPMEALAYSYLLSYATMMHDGYEIAEHHALIAEKLEAVERGDITRLMIFMPPRNGKPNDEETPCLMGDGSIKKLKDIIVGDYVITHTGNARRVNNVYIQGSLPCLEIITDTGHVVNTAYDHPFLTPTGYKQAQDLRERESLALMSDDITKQSDNEFVHIEKNISPKVIPVKIKSIKKIENKLCRCLNVDIDHTFLANYIVVHNTLLSSELFPAWYIGRNPNKQIIYATYSFDRATDVGRKIRNQLIDPLHQEVFTDCHISPDSKGANKLSTQEGGNIFSVGVHGAVTGRGANCMFGDSLIETDVGPLKISILVKNFIDKKDIKVLSLNEDSKELSYNKIIASRRSIKHELYTVSTKLGNTIKSTGDHRFYVLGKGFVRAQNLQKGDRLVASGQAMYNLWENPKSTNKIKRCLHGLLQRNPFNKDRIHMRLLQRNIDETTLRNSKGNQKRSQRSLLFSKMLNVTSRNKKPKKMCDLWKTNTAKDNEILLRHLSRRNKERYQEEDRSNIPLSWCNDETNIVTHNKTRQRQMRSLRKTKQNNKIQTDNEAHISSTSYRQEQEEQFSNQSNNTMLQLPFEPSQQCFEDTIESINIDSNGEHEVYDIQVEKNGNFFADGVLVHNCFLIDDPVKGREDAESESARKKLKDWFTSVAYSRMMPGKSAIIVIMCLVGDTPILMGDGSWKPIKEIKNGDIVMSFENGKHVKREVLNSKNQGEDEIFQVKMCNHIVKGNKRHPFLVKKDDKYIWVKLEDLKKNNEIVVSNIYHHNEDPVFNTESDEFITSKVEKITKVDSEDVYDIQVAGSENFIADGAVVHNTRWHMDDLAGWLLTEKAHENWEVLSLPAIAEEDDDLIGRKEGEALWPSAYPKPQLDLIRETVGTRDWNALFQQRPVGVGGSMVQLDWFERYNRNEVWKSLKYTDQYEQIIKRIVISWDTAFKEKEINDPSACTVWGEADNGWYLLYVFNKRLDYPKLKKEVIKIHKRYMEYDLGAISVLIEDKASGQSLIQDLKKDTKIPIIPIAADVNKVIRFSEVTAVIEGGRVFLPEKAPWLVPYETQIVHFPLDKHKDMVDSTSQFLRWADKPVYKKNPKRQFWK